MRSVSVGRIRRRLRCQRLQTFPHGFAQQPEKILSKRRAPIWTSEQRTPRDRQRLHPLIRGIPCPSSSPRWPHLAPNGKKECGAPSITSGATCVTWTYMAELNIVVLDGAVIAGALAPVARYPIGAGPPSRSDSAHLLEAHYGSGIPFRSCHQAKSAVPQRSQARPISPIKLAPRNTPGWIPIVHAVVSARRSIDY
jgi:hypothetical protein